MRALWQGSRAARARAHGDISDLIVDCHRSKTSACQPGSGKDLQQGATSPVRTERTCLADSLAWTHHGLLSAAVAALANELHPRRIARKKVTQNNHDGAVRA